MSDLQIFGLERLEDRVLLAVSINQNGGNLTITGDGDDNVIHVTNDNGDVRVLVDEDDDGNVDIDETYSGITNITIRTKGGDDYVYFSYLYFDGNLKIETAAGDDFVYIGPYAYPFVYGNAGSVRIGGDVKIDTGKDADFVSVLAVDPYVTYIDGKLEIKTQGGDDNVEVGAFFGAYLLVGGDVKIETHGGEDGVQVFAVYDTDSEVDFNGKLDIHTGNQDDTVFLGGEGYLDLDVSQVVIHTGSGSGSGDDFVVLYADGNLGGDGRIQIAGHLDIQTHNGDDDVRFIVSSAQGSDGEIVVYGQTHVDLGNAGPEGDEFRAYSSDDGGYIDFYGQFHLHHHKGQSHVFADEYETFHDDASVNGGNGYDEIEFFATYFGDLDIRNFESIST